MTDYTARVSATLPTISKLHPAADPRSDLATISDVEMRNRLLTSKVVLEQVGYDYEATIVSLCGTRHGGDTECDVAASAICPPLVQQLEWARSTTLISKGPYEEIKKYLR